MYDTLQALFWILTYFLIIVFYLSDKGKKQFYIPLTAILMNYAWELNAVIISRGLWVHILWVGLDTFIFYSHYRVLYHLCRSDRAVKNNKKKKQKKGNTTAISYYLNYTYLLGLVVFFIILLFIFRLKNGQLFSVFTIDLLMAVLFLLSINKLSLRGQIPIAGIKLLGDLFAWLFYKSETPFVNVVGILVLLINTIYFLFSILRRVRKYKAI